MSAIDKRQIPLPALVAAGLLMFDSIVGIHLYQVRKQAAPPPVSVSATALQSRQLRFVDEHDGVSVYGGHVRVFDVASGLELPQLRENEGFVRAVLNSLTFERVKRGVTGEPVFELVSWSDKRFTLEDLATGARISLGQFGSGNKAAFVRFFEHPEAAS